MVLAKGYALRPLSISVESSLFVTWKVHVNNDYISAAPYQDNFIPNPGYVSTCSVHA